MEYRPTRRSFLCQSALGAGGIVFIAGCGAPKQPAWRFFTDDEAVTVIALCGQIIPADQDPGATDANVINYIDKQLVNRHALDQDLYRIGLRGLGETSQARFGKPFAALAWEEQTQVLEALEKGRPEGASWEKLSPQGFFKTVIGHTMQGFYGSPRHGGNKDFVSFRMLGLDMPDIIGQNRYARGA